MIYRDYLPYKSARLYQDRGMAKWMGFFISEHTTALSTYGDTISFTDQMTIDEKLLLLQQLYLGKSQAIFYTSRQIEPYIGKVIDLTIDKIYFETPETILNLSLEEIIKIGLAESDEYSD